MPGAGLKAVLARGTCRTLHRSRWSWVRGRAMTGARAGRISRGRSGRRRCGRSWRSPRSPRGRRASPTLQGRRRRCAWSRSPGRHVCESTSMRSTAAWRALWALAACSVTGSSPSGARGRGPGPKRGPVVVHEHVQQPVVTERFELVDYHRCGGCRSALAVAGGPVAHHASIVRTGLCASPTRRSHLSRADREEAALSIEVLSEP
jgi:hypothetical protein